VAVRRLLHIAASLAGLGILVFLFYRLGPQNILSLFRQIGWRFLVVVVIYSAHILVRVRTLGLCLPEESRPSFKELLYIRIINETVRGLTLTGPFIAEPAAAWFMSKQGVRSTVAAAATVAEYVAHTFLSSCLTVFAVAYFLGHTSASAELRVAAYILLYGAVGFVAMTVVGVVGRIYLIGGIAKGLSKLPGLQRRIGGNLDAVRRTEDALLLVLRDRPANAARLMALEGVAHTLLILESYWVMIAMGLKTSFLTAFLAEVMTKLANVASVGATEGAYAVLFFGLGLPAAAGFTLSLVKRARSLAIALIGVTFLSLFPHSGKTGRESNFAR